MIYPVNFSHLGDPAWPDQGQVDFSRGYFQYKGLPLIYEGWLPGVINVSITGKRHDNTGALIGSFAYTAAGGFSEAVGNPDAAGFHGDRKAPAAFILQGEYKDWSPNPLNPEPISGIWYCKTFPALIPYFDFGIVYNGSGFFPPTIDLPRFSFDPNGGWGWYDRVGTVMDQWGVYPLVFKTFDQLNTRPNREGPDVTVTVSGTPKRTW